MAGQIETYRVYRFPTPHLASIMGARIQAFVSSGGGMHWQGGPARAVIWAGSLLAEEGTLYLSPGAVQAAYAAGLYLANGQDIPAAELPSELRLLLGEATDLNNS
jgi:hypothetical protein